MTIRQLNERDYLFIMENLNDWWSGRNMVDQLPSLFVRYFADTCLVVELDGVVAGFMIGFLAQSKPDVAYIHFAGMNPAFRRKGLGREMYQHFYRLAAEKGRSKIRLVTSTVNRLSLAFHTGIGFSLQGEDRTQDGFAYMRDYDGPGEDRFVFELQNPYC